MLKSEVPIEVYYAGKDEAFTGALKRAFHSLSGVKLLDLMEVLEARKRADSSAFLALPPAKVLKSYAAKVYAVQASSFRETILMDAGVVPFVDPLRLLTLKSYTQVRETGQGS